MNDISAETLFIQSILMLTPRAKYLNSEETRYLLLYQHPMASDGRFVILAQILNFSLTLRTRISPLVRPMISFLRAPEMRSMEPFLLNSTLRALSQPMEVKSSWSKSFSGGPV